MNGGTEFRFCPTVVRLHGQGENKMANDFVTPENKQILLDLLKEYGPLDAETTVQKLREKIVTKFDVKALAKEMLLEGLIISGTGRNRTKITLNPRTQGQDNMRDTTE